MPQSIFEYPNLDISKLLDGSVYYICGDKGTGKTMLLKYVESLIADNSDTNFSQFIRFKKDVDEDQRNQLKRAALLQAPLKKSLKVKFQQILLLIAFWHGKYI